MDAVCGDEEGEEDGLEGGERGVGGFEEGWGGAWGEDAAPEVCEERRHVGVWRGMEGGRFL